MRRILKRGGTIALIVCLFLSVIWANLAIAYQLPGSAGVRAGACLALDVIALTALVEVMVHKRWRAVLIYAGAYAIFLRLPSVPRMIRAGRPMLRTASLASSTATGSSLATFATLVGAPKRITQSVGSSGHTIFPNCGRSTCSLFIGWDRQSPTQL